MRVLLNQVASKAQDNWEVIELQLGIEQHQLNTINHHDPIRCYSEDVFSLWERKADPPFTWVTIIKALKAPIVGETKIAQDIEMQLI